MLGVGEAATDGDGALLRELVRIVEQFLYYQLHALLVGTNHKVVGQRGLEAEFDSIGIGEMEVTDYLATKFVATEGLLCQGQVTSLRGVADKHPADVHNLSRIILHHLDDLLRFFLGHLMEIIIEYL